MPRSEHAKNYEIFLIDRETTEEKLWSYAGTLPQVGEAIHDWRQQQERRYLIRIMGQHAGGGMVDLTNLLLEACPGHVN